MIVVGLVSPIWGQKKFSMPLWPERAVEQNGIRAIEVIENHHLINITQGGITVQFPKVDEANGAAILICPGGGYRFEAIYDEGFEFANWLNEHGIAGSVLKYCLPNGHASIPLTDAKQAIHIIRTHAV